MALEQSLVWICSKRCGAGGRLQKVILKWSKRTYRGGRPPRSKLMVGETDRRGLQKKVRFSHQKGFHVNQRNLDFVP